MGIFSQKGVMEKLQALFRAITSIEGRTFSYADSLAERVTHLEGKSDVAGLVGTKAELDSFDVTTIDINDVVKVLQDESNDGATTYYKWDSTSFIFVGGDPSRLNPTINTLPINNGTTFFGDSKIKQVTTGTAKKVFIEKGNNTDTEPAFESEGLAQFNQNIIIKQSIDFKTEDNTVYDPETNPLSTMIGVAPFTSLTSAQTLKSYISINPKKCIVRINNFKSVSTSYGTNRKPLELTTPNVSAITYDYLNNVNSLQISYSAGSTGRKIGVYVNGILFFNDSGVTSSSSERTISVPGTIPDGILEIRNTSSSGTVLIHNISFNAVSGRDLFNHVIAVDETDVAEVTSNGMNFPNWLSYKGKEVATKENIIPFTQTQSDWNQTNINRVDYIKNKPVIPAPTTVTNNLTSTSTTTALSAAQGKVLNDTKENINNKGVPNGYASLDSDGKVPVSQLPTTSSGDLSTVIPKTDFNNPSNVGQSMMTNISSVTPTGDNIRLIYDKKYYNASGVGTMAQSNITIASATNTAAGVMSAADKVKLNNVPTQIGLSGVTATTQTFNGTSPLVIPITAIPATLLTGIATINTTGSAATLASPKYLDGLLFNGSSDVLRYGVTSGTSSAYVLGGTVSSGMVNIDGLRLSFKPHITNALSPTLDCGFGPKPLLDANGNTLSPGVLNINKIYDIIRDATAYKILNLNINYSGQVKANYTGLSVTGVTANVISTLPIHTAVATLSSSPTTKFPVGSTGAYNPDMYIPGATPATTARLRENNVQGQVHRWRIIGTYANKAAANTGRMSLRFRNPDSGFIFPVGMTLPSGLTGDDFALEVTTIADNLSLSTGRGYVLEQVCSFTDANLVINITSITRDSEAMENI